jgi:UDP-N-acetylglucosamine 3-dehydrogenase
MPGQVATLQAAVIGSGSMGQHHVRILSQHPAVSSVAVCDPDVEARAAIAGRFPITPFADLAALLAGCPRLDFAVIAVPTTYHYEVTRRLLASGVHCLVEKPIASTPEEGARLACLAEASGKVLSVGHVERFNPAVRALRQLIAQGALGDIKMVTCRRAGPGPAPARRGKINVLVDIGIHDVDVVNFLLSRYPRDCQAFGGSTQESETEDYALVILDYGNAVAQIHADWITPVKIRQLEVVGTAGYGCLEYVTQELRLYRSHDMRAPIDFSEFLLRFGPQDRGQRVDVELAEPLRVELDGFIDAILWGGKEIVPPSSAIEALRIVTEATERIRQRRGA